jgi:hypothetical protein
MSLISTMSHTILIVVPNPWILHDNKFCDNNNSFKNRYNCIFKNNHPLIHLRMRQHRRPKNYIPSTMPKPMLPINDETVCSIEIYHNRRLRVLPCQGGPTIPPLPPLLRIRQLQPCFRKNHFHPKKCLLDDLCPHPRLAWLRIQVLAPCR